MKYCGRCGKTITGESFKERGLSYHGECFARLEVYKEPEILIGKRVRHINEEKVAGELKDLESRLSMINHQNPVLVRVK